PPLAVIGPASETKGWGSASNRRALLGLLRGETGCGRWNPLRVAGASELGGSAGALLLRLLSAPLSLQSALYAAGRRLVPARLWHAGSNRTGPAVSLPGLPAAAADACRDRLLGVYAAVRTPEDRVYLRIWSWHAGGAGVADFGSRESR